MEKFSFVSAASRDMSACLEIQSVCVREEKKKKKKKGKKKMVFFLFLFVSRELHVCACVFAQRGLSFIVLTLTRA